MEMILLTKLVKIVLLKLNDYVNIIIFVILSQAMFFKVSSLCTLNLGSII